MNTENTELTDLRRLLSFAKKNICFFRDFRVHKKQRKTDFSERIY